MKAYQVIYYDSYGSKFMGAFSTAARAMRAIAEYCGGVNTIIEYDGFHERRYNCLEYFSEEDWATLLRTVQENITSYALGHSHGSFLLRGYRVEVLEIE